MPILSSPSGHKIMAAPKRTLLQQLYDEDPDSDGTPEVIVPGEGDEEEEE